MAPNFPNLDLTYTSLARVREPFEPYDWQTSTPSHDFRRLEPLNRSPKQAQSLEVRNQSENPGLGVARPSSGLQCTRW